MGKGDNGSQEVQPNTCDTVAVSIVEVAVIILSVAGFIHATAQESVEQTAIKNNLSRLSVLSYKGPIQRPVSFQSMR